MISTRPSWYITLFILILLTFFSIVLATSLGGVTIPLKDTFFVLLNQLPFVNLPVDKDISPVIITNIRFPRVLTAGLVGAALAISGTVMQGIFRNPMASPSIIGVATGGSFGAVLAILFGLSAIHYLFVPLLGFIFSFLTLMSVYLISTEHGKTSMMTLLLSGIAISAFLSSVISLIISFSNQSVMQQIVFWLMGDLQTIGWTQVHILILPVIIGIIILTFFSRDLDILLLGEEHAKNIGVNIQFSRKVLLITASLLTGVSVSLTGTIGFVGLVVPHILRLIIGPTHRYLILASAFGGAIFLILVDLIARMIIRPAEIQVGIITSFIGAPFFLYLIWSKRKKGELL